MLRFVLALVFIGAALRSSGAQSDPANAPGVGDLAVAQIQVYCRV